MSKEIKKIIAALLLVASSTGVMVEATELKSNVKEEQKVVEKTETKVDQKKIEEQSNEESTVKKPKEETHKKIDIKALEARAIENITIGKSMTKTLKPNESRTYKVNISKAGLFRVDIASYGGITYSIYDSNGDQIDYERMYGSTDNPKKFYDLYHLNTSNYYIVMENRDNDSGKFSLKTTLTVENITEKEPNNGTATAQSIPLSSSHNKGLLGWKDGADVYKVKVDKSGKLDIKLKSFSNVKINFLNEQGEEAFWDYSRGSRENPNIYINDMYLNPGTYYIKIENRESDAYGGVYELSTKFTYANNNDKEPNNGTVTAQKMNLNSTINGFLAWNDDVDMFKVSIPRKMNIKLNLKSYSNQRIEILNNNGEGISNFDINWGASDNPTVLNETVELNKGTYYVKVSKYSGSGKYSLSVSTKTFSDTSGHWAEREIESFANKGYIATNKAKFEPNRSITRAEFIKLVNKVFGYKNYKNVEKFSDVNSKDWYFHEINAALNAGYITSKNATFRPNAPITREEVANIITSIKKCKDSNLDKLNKYSDKNKVSTWAKSSVEGAIEKGYMGQGSKQFRPKDNITRAESVVTLTRVANSK